jgi:hypothetical protein
MRVLPAYQAFDQLCKVEVAAREGFVALDGGVLPQVRGSLSQRPFLADVPVVDAASHGADDAPQRVEGGSRKRGGKSPFSFGDIAEHEKKFLRLCIGFIRRAYPKKTAQHLEANHDISGRSFRDWSAGRLPSCRHLLRLLIDHKHDFLEAVLHPLIAAQKVGAKAKRLKIRLPKFRRHQTQEAM